MNITVWGCRGSLPTPDPRTVKYGGNTTCLELRLADGTLIVVDAGSGLRNLGQKLLAEGSMTEMYLLLTHSHWDHLMGFPFFVPAYLPKFKIHVRGGPLAKRSLKAYLAHQMDPPYFPVKFDAMKAAFDFTEDKPKRRSIGCAEVIPMRLSHPNGGYGYKFAEDGKSLVIFTDNELGTQHEGGPTRDEFVEFCRGADLLIHDAQYTDEQYVAKKGWGHSTIGQTIELGRDAKVRRLGLFHHDPDRTDEDLDRLQGQVVEAGMGMECFFVREGMSLTV